MRDIRNVHWNFDSVLERKVKKKHVFGIFMSNTTE